MAAEVGVPDVPDEFRDADEEFDVDDLPDGELEDLEEELVDQASAARTIAELECEISRLDGAGGAGLPGARGRARTASGRSCRTLLQHTPEMFDARAVAAAS